MDVLAHKIAVDSETSTISGNTRKREKRKATRDPISGSLTILWGTNSQDERISRATLIDLSDRGAKFRVAERIPAGSWLMFNYHQVGASGRGTVRYREMVKSCYNIGVEFSGGTGWNPASNRFTTELRNLSIAVDRFQDPDSDSTA
jgi:PilZ domain